MTNTTLVMDPKRAAAMDRRITKCAAAIESHLASIITAIERLDPTDRNERHFNYAVLETLAASLRERLRLRGLEPAEDALVSAVQGLVAHAIAEHDEPLDAFASTFTRDDPIGAFVYEALDLAGIKSVPDELHLDSTSNGENYWLTASAADQSVIVFIRADDESPTPVSRLKGQRVEPGDVFLLDHATRTDIYVGQLSLTLAVLSVLPDGCKMPRLRLVK